MHQRKEGFVYSREERRRRQTRGDRYLVVLRRKLAEMIDGVNLAGYRAGDRLLLNARDASLLIAEGWAEVPSRLERRRKSDTVLPRR